MYNCNEDISLSLTHTHTHTHTQYSCVINTVGCGTSHKYTDIQIYGVNYFEHFTKTAL